MNIPGLGLIANHNFVVTGASFPGDPDATVISFGMNEQGYVGRVDQATRGLTGQVGAVYGADTKAWLSLAGSTVDNPNLVSFSASAESVLTAAGSVVESTDYALFASPLGANSSSGAQAVANRACGCEVPTPGGWRLTIGAGSWREIQFAPR